MYLYGAREYACMQKLVPVSLTSCIGLANMHVVLLSLVALIAFLMSFLRLVILWMVSDLFGAVFLICGHVRRLPMRRPPQ